MNPATYQSAGPGQALVPMRVAVDLVGATEREIANWAKLGLAYSERIKRAIFVGLEDVQALRRLAETGGDS